MLILTNRNLFPEKLNTDGVGDEQVFGSYFNSKGPREIRIADCQRVAGKWKVQVVVEPQRLTSSNLPSREIFSHFRKKLIDQGKNCVFFVHGFNQSFLENLQKSYRIEKRYNVGVVAFSWPSSIGGFGILTYKQAQKAAVQSCVALDSALEKIALYRREVEESSEKKSLVKFTLLANSLGNLLLQKLVCDDIYMGSTNIFDNVVLVQADVDNRGHEEWVDNIHCKNPIYITLNEDDVALNFSDDFYANGKSRLGCSRRNLCAHRAVYFNFTHPDLVGNVHELFLKAKNPEVEKFFMRVLNGKSPETTTKLVFNERTNAYEFLVPVIPH